MGEIFSFGVWLKQRRSALLLSRDDLARQVGCDERFRTERLVAAARAQLDPATFDAAWAAGAALTLEQAIDEALDEHSVPPNG